MNKILKTSIIFLSFLGLNLSNVNAESTLTFSIGPSTSENAKYTVNMAKNADYTITVKGFVTTTYGGLVCVYDFLYLSCNGGTPVLTSGAIQTGGPGLSTQPFSDLAFPKAAYNPTHVYTFKYKTSDNTERFFWALPQDRPDTTTTYQGGYEVTLQTNATEEEAVGKYEINFFIHSGRKTSKIYG